MSTYAIPHATSAVLARQILKQEGIQIPVVTTLHGTDITIVGRDPSFQPVVNYSINRIRWRHCCFRFSCVTRRFAVLM